MGTALAALMGLNQPLFKRYLWRPAIRHGYSFEQPTLIRRQLCDRGRHQVSPPCLHKGGNLCPRETRGRSERHRQRDLLTSGFYTRAERVGFE